MKFNLDIEYDQKRAQQMINTAIEKGEWLEIKKITRSRTTSQNKYLHVCLVYFCKETGYTVDEAKILLKRQLDWMIYKKGESIFLRSTAELSKDEMIQFIEYIRQVCTDQLGIYVPTSEEYLQNQFEIERELQ